MKSKNNCTATWEDKGQSREKVLSDILKFQEQDTLYDSGFIFDSESTQSHPFAEEVYRTFMYANMMKKSHASVQSMEKEVVKLLGDLFHGEDVAGYMASGGTEANIVAFWAAKSLGEGRDEILVPSHSHYSIEKITRLLDLKKIVVPVKENHHLDVNELKKNISDRTLGIFATAGTSELGVIDPIEELSDIALKNNLYLHVDAAYGGFIIPFMRELGYDAPNFDFSFEGVSSISVDPHKMGRVPLPAGAIIFRDKEYLDAISFETQFPKMTNYTLLGSRPGAPIAATWALMNFLGREGYREGVRKVMDNTSYLVQKLSKIKDIDLVIDPQINIVSFNYGNNENTQKLHRFLTNEGYKITPNARPYSIRLVVGAHVERPHIEKLVNKIERYSQLEK